MKRAADFRAIARDALKGKWWLAVLTGFIASLLGGVVAFGNSGYYSNINIEDDYIEGISPDVFTEEAYLIIVTVLMVLVLLLSILTIAQFIVGGAVKMGYSVFNLKLVDGKEVKFSDLFSRFNRFGAGFCMNLLVAIYTFLWTLLFIIPGIIKSFSYAMTPFILAENPEMTANQAITKSRHLMDGNKWRLFCLGFSFIGWGLLCIFPTLMCVFIIGMLVAAGGGVITVMFVGALAVLSLLPALFLQAYQQAAYAAFYRDITEGYRVVKDENLKELDGGWYDC